MKRWYCLIVLFLAVFRPLPAATVSFLVIETGLGSEGDHPASSHAWENGLMNLFFDEGHIVSNAPMLRLQSVSQDKFPREAQGDFNDAREGGVDFFVVVLLSYKAGDPVEKPQSVLRLFSVSSGNLLYETACSSADLQDEAVNVKTAGKKLVPALNREDRGR